MKTNIIGRIRTAVFQFASRPIASLRGRCQSILVLRSRIKNVAMNYGSARNLKPWSRPFLLTALLSIAVPLHADLVNKDTGEHWHPTWDKNGNPEPAPEWVPEEVQDEHAGTHLPPISSGSYTFEVHFTVLTSNTSATAKATKKQMKKEVTILNDYFVSRSRGEIVTFVFKSASLYADIQSSSCELVRMSNDGRAYDSNEWEAAIDACSDPKVVDPNTINFFVYDNFDGGYSDTTSRGKLNSHHPYVLIDWQRLDHTNQSPEEHEMGHAFGLEHVCNPKATSTTSTNIMTSSGDYPDANGTIVDCPGSGGLRNIGFRQPQVDTILANAQCIKEELDTGTNSC